MSRRLAPAALVPVAVLVAVCAVFVHAATWRPGATAWPVGLLLALAGSAGLLVLGTLSARTRWGSAAVAAAWLLTVLLLSLPRPEGDVLVRQDAVGVAFLVVGVVLAGIAIGLPAGGLRYSAALAEVSPPPPPSP